jgi:signal transduction histidine kinase
MMEKYTFKLPKTKNNKRKGMNALRLFYTPPEHEDYEMDKRVKFLHITLWVVFVAMLIFGYHNVRENAIKTAQSMFFAAGISLLGLYLNYTRKYYLSAAILTSVVMFVAFFNLYDGISLYDPGITALPVIIIFTGFLFGKKSIIPMTILNIAVVFSLIWFEKAGIINPPTLSDFSRATIISILLVTAAILLRAILDLWENSLGRARASEQKLKEIITEVSKARDNLEINVVERTADLQRANEELEAFAYSVSHDLRAPLRAINGYSKILMEEHSEDLETDIRDLLNKIHENTRKMDSLIDGMLLLSRVGRSELSLQVVEIAQLAEEIYSNIEKDLQDRNVVFQVLHCPGVLADEKLVDILLTNLLSNAIKFTRSRTNTEIEIGSFKKDRKSIYYVRDNGIGFDMQYAKHIFSPFQRYHNQEEYEGTGIGLAIASRIVQRHNGEIWIESQPEQGTSVYFSLGK